MIPQGGARIRGLYQPGEWRLMVRERTVCAKCGRDLDFWRKIGVQVDGIKRCNGEDRAGCGAVRCSANELRQMLNAPPKRRSLARRHLDRRWTCPRPDKHAHEGQEDAERHLFKMRAAYPASTGTLKTYPCKCTFWHIGNAPRS